MIMASPSLSPSPPHSSSLCCSSSLMGRLFAQVPARSLGAISRFKMPTLLQYKCTEEKVAARLEKGGETIFENNRKQRASR